jgi:hypothetical protein
MDLPGLTTSAGTRTDYSVGPWDVGYYAPRDPNLSKLCATCLFLRVTDLGEATFIFLGYSPW